MKPAWAQLKEGIGDHSRLFRLQSAHILLGSSFSRALIVCEFWAAWPGVGRRDIIATTQGSMCERVRETMRATQLFLGGGRQDCGLRLHLCIRMGENASHAVCSMRSLSDSKYTTLYIVCLLCFSLKDFFKVKFNKIGLVHSNDASFSPYHACRLFCSLGPRKTNG